jgi:hypothetical protein
LAGGSLDAGQLSISLGVLTVLPKFVVFGIALIACGCKPNGGLGGKDVGTVSGKVTYNGQPVAGRITFHTASGSPISAMIKPDGNYVAPSIPVGEAKITIDTSDVGRSRENYDERAKLSSGAKGSGAYKRTRKDEPMPEPEKKTGAELNPEAALEDLEPGSPEFEKAKQFLAGRGNPLASAKQQHIPPKYTNPGTTPESIEVKSREQVKDIILSD